MRFRGLKVSYYFCNEKWPYWCFWGECYQKSSKCIDFKSFLNEQLSLINMMNGTIYEIWKFEITVNQEFMAATGGNLK